MPVQHRILKSIIEITRHRDLDSLEYAFAATVHELAPARSVTLYRIPRGSTIEDVEEVVRLEIRHDEVSGSDGFSWTREPHLVPASDTMLRTIRKGASRNVESEDGYNELQVPISGGERIVGLLTVVSDEDLSEYLSVIEAYATIYGNYVSVLHESEHDKLTGLLNRRTFDHKLSRLLKSQSPWHQRDASEAQARRNWLAVMDVDHFKRINDSFGHVYGDEILLVMAQKLIAHFRPEDLLFRVGGEEFVIVLAPVTAERADELLEGYRELIATTRFPNVDEVTVSIGYAPIDRGDYPRRIFDLADKALYYAKQHGRNQVWNYQTLVERGFIAEHDRSGSIELF